MKLLMAVLAVYAMTAAVVFDLVEHADMALGALGYGQWFRGLGIKVSASFAGSGGSLGCRLLCTGKEHRGFSLASFCCCPAFGRIDRHAGNSRGNEKNGEDIVKNFSFLFHKVFLSSESSKTQNNLDDRLMEKKKSEQ
ncbi:MAG: hypothetical protein AB1545_01310 [Thermodesulfobacteriota bacterium]